VLNRPNGTEKVSLNRSNEGREGFTLNRSNGTGSGEQHRSGGLRGLDDGAEAGQQ
jgi:hypothetical protein